MHCLCLKTFALYGSLHYMELHYKDLLLYHLVYEDIQNFYLDKFTLKIVNINFLCSSNKIKYFTECKINI